jgi:hypothetical protein
MGLIQASPDEIARVGAGIEALAPELGGLLSAARSLGNGVADPPATAAALQRVSSKWATATERLGDEISAIGRATGATAIAYRVTDENAMGGGAPLIPASTTAAGGGGGGGGSW